jgi:hypothetical protein
MHSSESNQEMARTKQDLIFECGMELGKVDLNHNTLNMLHETILNGSIEALKLVKTCLQSIGTSPLQATVLIRNLIIDLYYLRTGQIRPET